MDNNSTHSTGLSAGMLNLFKCKGTKAFSLHGKRAPCEDIVDFYIAFEGTDAMTGGYGGNRFHCLLEVPGL